MRELFLFIVAYLLVTLLTPFVVLWGVYIRFINGSNVKDYLLDCAVGFDQAGGSVIYQQPNFTISSYTYFMCKNGKYCWFMKFIDLLFGKEHCKNSYIDEVKEDREDLNCVARY